MPLVFYKYSNDGYNQPVIVSHVQRVSQKCRGSLNKYSTNHSDLSRLWGQACLGPLNPRFYGHNVYLEGKQVAWARSYPAMALRLLLRVA
jgi:hypothetical protein